MTTGKRWSSQRLTVRPRGRMGYGFGSSLLWPDGDEDAQKPSICYVFIDHRTAKGLGTGGILSHSAVAVGACKLRRRI